MTTQKHSFDINIYRGDTFTKYIMLYEDEELTTPIGAKGITFKCTARIGPNDAELFNIGAITTDVDGELILTMSSDETKEIGAKGLPHAGRFDIEATADNLIDIYVYTVAVGNVYITDDYTYGDES